MRSRLGLKASKKLRRKARRLLQAIGLKKSTPKIKDYHDYDFSELSDSRLVAIVRHEAHRIEKSHYNQIFESKRAYFEMRRDNLQKALAELTSRGQVGSAAYRWGTEISKNFESLEKNYIHRHSRQADPLDFAASDDMLHSFERRVSARIWKDKNQQPALEEFLKIGGRMVRAAIQAPTSGNRQPWRFRFIHKEEEKRLLVGVKEEHCYTAPFLIFIGMDSSLYGAFSDNESGLYIDAGAAIMQMVDIANVMNLGVCWNHFAPDLIHSREKNVEIYQKFSSQMGFSDELIPVAIIAIGLPEFLPPKPPREVIEDYLI